MIFRKIVDCKSFESSQDNLYNGVYFGKVASSQCIDCNLSINRICHIFISEYVKIPVSETIHWENTSVRCTNVLIKLSLFISQLAISPKTELTLHLFEEVLKVLITQATNVLSLIFFLKCYMRSQCLVLSIIKKSHFLLVSSGKTLLALKTQNFH